MWIVSKHKNREVTLLIFYNILKEMKIIESFPHFIYISILIDKEVVVERNENNTILSILF